MSKAFVAGLVTLGVVAPVAAHHSVVAQFDREQQITLTGTVTKVEWQNPHIWVYLDVTDARGNVTQWECEGAGPITLRRLGWRRDTLKDGDTVTVEGNPSRDGSNRCHSLNWTLADGTQVFARIP